MERIALQQFIVWKAEGNVRVNSLTTLTSWGVNCKIPRKGQGISQLFLLHLQRSAHAVLFLPERRGGNVYT